MAPINVEDVLSKLSNKEKVDLLSGIDYWHTAAIPRLGVPSIRLSDGPNGVRGTKNFNGVPAACFPCGTALGSTFNQKLLEEAGDLMGRESRAKGAHVLLGPCVNMQRSPLGGRGFESISEDPVLAGLAASAMVKGIEKNGVSSCLKHFVCNDQEHQRTLYNAIVTDRALREIYLKPFQIATRNSKPSTYMTAYNKINGTHASENQKTLNDILRGEWGWEGMVMSDWFGTYSTSEGLIAGLDLEMPGPTRWRAVRATHALSSGKVSQQTVDERARALLRLANRSIESNIPENAPEGKLDTPETAALLRKIAGESIVLMKNEHGILPLKKIKSTALIGPNAQTAVYCGGGSSSVPPYYAISPWQAVKSRLDKGTPLDFAIGTYSHKELPILGARLKTAEGKEGFNFKVYNEPPSVRNREIAEDITLTDSNMLFMDFKSPRVPDPLWYATITGTFTPEVDGLYDFGLCVYGTADLYVNDKLLVDNTHNQKQGTVFYGCGTLEEIASINLKKGSPYAVRVEFASAPTNTLGSGGVARFGGGGVRIGGARRIDPKEEITFAVKVAKQADQVVVCAGLNSDWEGEGHDRANMRLPGHMDELIAAVTKANSHTVVVMQTGSPVEMPWIEDVPAVLQAWYGGNETGNAIADALFGDINPSGKSSLSWPQKVEHNPAFLNFRSEAGRTLYGEDVYIGYRYYESISRDVLFPFGHGLSYTTFELSNLDVSVTKDGTTISVTTSVENTGAVPGAEVVQIYVSQNAPSIRRAPKELQGFEKVFLQPKEKTKATVTMPLKYATGYWDEARRMWVCEQGKYLVRSGTSSHGVFLEGEFDVKETFWWKGL